MFVFYFVLHLVMLRAYSWHSALRNHSRLCLGNLMGCQGIEYRSATGMACILAMLLIQPLNYHMSKIKYLPFLEDPGQLNSVDFLSYELKMIMSYYPRLYPFGNNLRALVYQKLFLYSFCIPPASSIRNYSCQCPVNHVGGRDQT